MVQSLHRFNRRSVIKNREKNSEDYYKDDTLTTVFKMVCSLFKFSTFLIFFLQNILSSNVLDCFILLD